MPQPRKRPNVLLFVSDQQRADTIPGGAAAARITPHLDWFAPRCQTLTNAFCTTPICSPSRASLLSGLYPHNHGMVANHQQRDISREMSFPRDVPVLADLLASGGYACAYTGKWHLGTGSDRRGFTSFVTRHGDHDVTRDEDNEIKRFADKVGVTLKGKQMGLDPDRSVYDTRTKVGPSLLPLAFHPSHRDARAAAQFIRSRAGETDPFCLVYSCHEPHEPFVSPRPFDTLVRPEDVTLPDSWRQPVDPALIARRSPWWRLEAVDGRLDEADLRRIWAAYLGAVAYVDHLFGIILEALIDTDQFEETLLIFTSDHGDMMGAHNVVLKGAVLFEEVVRVPLMIRVPGLRAREGVTVPQLASLADVVPTILSHCGVPASGHFDGVDLSPLLAGSGAPVHEGVALEFHSSNWGEQPSALRGWRTEDWKYVEEVAGPAELYDLRSDPGETVNHVADPRFAPERERLAGELHAWLAATGDRWPQIPKPERLVEPPGGNARK